MSSGEPPEEMTGQQAVPVTKAQTSSR
jgi:hypothetical protein